MVLKYDERFQIFYGLLIAAHHLWIPTHLRVAGFPSNWAVTDIIKDLINGFIGSRQETGDSLRNLRSEIKHPWGL